MAEINENKNSMALVLGPDWLSETKSPTIKVFVHVDELVDYVLRQTMETTLFNLFISDQYLKQVLKNNLHNLAQIESINSYYDSEIELQKYTQLLRNVNPKLHFFMTRDLLMRLTDFIDTHLCSDVSRPVSKSNSFKRRKRSKVKRAMASNSSYRDLTCHKCRTIFQDPFQLTCGHRQCRSCIEKQEGNLITCVLCLEETPKNQAWFDRGFKKEIDSFNAAIPRNESQ